MDYANTRFACARFHATWMNYANTRFACFACERFHATWTMCGGHTVNNFGAWHQAMFAFSISLQFVGDYNRLWGPIRGCVTYL